MLLNTTWLIRHCLLQIDGPGLLLLFIFLKCSPMKLSQWIRFELVFASHALSPSVTWPTWGKPAVSTALLAADKRDPILLYRLVGEAGGRGAQTHTHTHTHIRFLPFAGLSRTLFKKGVWGICSLNDNKKIRSKRPYSNPLLLSLAEPSAICLSIYCARVCRCVFLYVGVVSITL